VPWPGGDAIRPSAVIAVIDSSEATTMRVSRRVLASRALGPDRARPDAPTEALARRRDSDVRGARQVWRAVDVQTACPCENQDSAR
jgi:hypothetical protein